MVKKIFKIIAYGIFSLAALIVLLIVLAALLISSPPGERFLKNMLQPRLEQILGCKVRIGGIDLKILTRARLENVSISREIPGMGDIPLL